MAGRKISFPFSKSHSPHLLFYQEITSLSFLMSWSSCYNCQLWWLDHWCLGHVGRKIFRIYSLNVFFRTLACLFFSKVGRCDVYYIISNSLTLRPFPFLGGVGDKPVACGNSGPGIEPVPQQWQNQILNLLRHKRTFFLVVHPIKLMFWTNLRNIVLGIYLMFSCLRQP